MYFTDKQAASKYMAMRTIEQDPKFKERVTLMYQNSESYADYGSSEDVAEFVVSFLTEETSYASILTAFAHNKSRTGDPLRSPESVLPVIYGVLLNKLSSGVAVCTTFDAKPVITAVIDDIKHLDHHGVQLVTKLVHDQNWSNLIDFCFSLLGTTKALSITEATEHELGSDPVDRIIKFNNILNQIHIN